MSYKVGALILKNDCVLLNMDNNNGNKYCFPTWDYNQGEIPIESINSKLKEIGIKNGDKCYMGKYNINKANIYLYLIKNWEGKIKEKNCIWVHKAVLMMNKNYFPLDKISLKEIF
jgi:hypothetical protein